jgi:endoplasmic reticulum junction formation protein lunapark
MQTMIGLPLELNLVRLDLGHSCIYFLFRIYLVRMLIFKWYNRQKLIKVELLEELRKKQQLKVEELKKKTSYYLTKGLIERYDSPTKEEKELRKRNTVSTPSNKQIPINNNHTPSRPVPIMNTNTPQPVQFPRQPNVIPPQINRLPSKRTWLDKIMDSIVGEEEGPERKYALICEKCFQHNGLVWPEEYSDASTTN